MLTEKQREVLYGLIKYPALNDRELSEIIHVNKSTIATIKNRFRNSGYYRTIRIPHLDRFGFELMTISYSAMNPFLSRRSKLELENIFNHFSDTTINMVMKSTDGAWQSIALDFTQAKEQHDLFLQLDAKYHFLRTNEIETIFFPFRTSRIVNYWDYSFAIAHYLDKEISPEEEEHRDVPNETEGYTKEIPTELRDFSELEKRALYGFLKFPRTSDRSLAKKISMSRNTLTSIRHKFEDAQLIRTIRVPNFKKLGFGLMVFTHIKLRPKSISQSYKLRQLYSPYEFLVPDVFSILSETDFISVGVYQNITEFEEIRNRITRRLRDELSSLREPTHIIFSIPDMNVIRQHSYLPIISRFLGLKMNINQQIVDTLFRYVGYLSYYMIYSLRRRLDLVETDLGAKEVSILTAAIKKEIEPLVGSTTAKKIEQEIAALNKK